MFEKLVRNAGYEFPTDRQAKRSGDSVRLEIRAEELALLLEGIELASVKRRPRYQRPQAARTEAGAATP